MLIGFEGIPGAGKSTQTAKALRWLRYLGYQATASRAFGPKERRAVSALVGGLQIEATSMSMMFIFQALHARHCQITKQALSTNEVVITDCWRHPFLAYHTSFGRMSSIPEDYRKTLDSLAYEDLEPDITFFFQISADRAFARYVKRESKHVHRVLALEDNYALARMAAYYESEAAKNGWVVVPAERTIAEVADYIRVQLERLLKRKVC